MKSIVGIVLLMAITTAKVPAVQTPDYTEDLEVFKKDKNIIRMQLLAGCWLIVNDHLTRVAAAQKQAAHEGNDTEPAAVPERQPLETSEITPVSVAMVKKCMKKITLKEAVVKVTELVGKNLTQPKSFLEIVESFEQEEISGQSSVFDSYLSNVLQNYTRDLKELKSKNIKDYLESELNKNKYYFGFIPATNTTRMIFMAMLTVAFVSCCTCFKYFRRTQKNRQEDRKKKKGAAAAPASRPSEQPVLPLKRKTL